VIAYFIAVVFLTVLASSLLVGLRNPSLIIIDIYSKYQNLRNTIKINGRCINIKAFDSAAN
jgi:hypothetical protein